MGVRRPNVQRVTARFTSIGTSAWVPIVLGVDVTSGFLHVEDGAAYYVRGHMPGNIVNFDAGAVVDNEDGTVSLPCTGHPLLDGDTIRINAGQTDNYVGEFELQTGSEGEDVLIIEADYVEETLAATKFCIGYVDGAMTGDMTFDAVNAGEAIWYIKAVAGTISVSVMAEGV